MQDYGATIFQILSAIAFAGGLGLGEDFLIIASAIPVTISIILWYQNNVSRPIKKLSAGLNGLNKDLNIRKELEDIRLDLAGLKNMIKNRRGALDPGTFIILLILLALLILYLKKSGLF